MNNTNIKLNKYKSSLSVNVQNKLEFDIESSQKLFPADSMQSTIDKYEQYLKECDESNIYRLIFTINPLCSNVLFNHITEVIKGEGSDVCELVDNYNDIKETTFGKLKFDGSMTDILKCEFTTRDTALSHPHMCKWGSSAYQYGEKNRYEHKCGIDIFNNHLLRKKDFIIINKTNSKPDRYFNTLFDILRDPFGNGEDGVVEITQQASTTSQIHIYNTDNIYSFDDAITNNLKEVDGWFGFINQAQLKTSNFTDESAENICLNRVINNKRECDFIDLYPDRTLFSFVPKWNKFRNRAEYNWEYCITYPYKNSYDCDLIHHKLKGTTTYVDGFKATCDDDIHIDDATANTVNFEAKNMTLKSDIRHGLKIGDTIYIDIISETNNREYLLHCYSPIRVVSIGKNGYDNDYYFSIAFNDIVSEMLQTLNNGYPYHFRIRRFANGKVCKYYMRIFKKLPCFEDTQHYAKDGITDEDIDDALKNNTFSTTLNKLAFAKNAYGDDLAQILFNDDIITTGLRDNLGRELSEIFLTIIKTNKGYEKWYEKNIYNSSDIEYSHCFGKITSGFDLPVYSYTNNVHRLHNIIRNQSYNTDIFPTSDTPIESNITINGTLTSNGDYNYEFVGDIVELDENTLTEKVLEKIQHRFNTAQREVINSKFKELMVDNIISDDYMSEGFKTTTNDIMTYKNIKYWGNLSPEGYYYQAHYPILLHEYNTTINEGYHTAVKVVSSYSISDNSFYMVVDKNYYFNPNDTVYVFHKKTLEKHIGTILTIVSTDYTNLTIKIPTIQAVDLSEFYLYKPNILMPSTAYDLNDGTGKYIWRDFIPTIDIRTTSELYNIPFTNGAHYMYKNINFYLKRQDPYGDYKLAPTYDNYGGDKEITSLYGELEIIGNDKDVTNGDYFEEGDNNIC